MADQVNSLAELQARLNAWLVEYRKLPEVVTLHGGAGQLSRSYQNAFQRVDGWYTRFKGNLMGEDTALKRLSSLVLRARSHPSNIALHQISTCLQDAVFGAYTVSMPTTEPDGPVGGESGGTWRHAGKVVGGLGHGKAFKIFFEAHLVGLGRRIQPGKFSLSSKLAVRDVSKIIEKIESESGVRFPWQLEKTGLNEVLVVPRKSARRDRGTKRPNSARSKPAGTKAPRKSSAKNVGAKSSGKSSLAKTGLGAKKPPSKSPPPKTTVRARKPGTKSGT